MIVRQISNNNHELSVRIKPVEAERLKSGFIRRSKSAKNAIGKDLTISSSVEKCLPERRCQNRKP